MADKETFMFNQFAFFPWQSCRGVNLGEDVDVVFMDFAKAFDKVPHIRLCRKLESHGIADRLLVWILEWLVGRLQSCREYAALVLRQIHTYIHTYFICHKESHGIGTDWANVLSGVLQGSALRSVLFVIDINDIDCGVKWSNVNLKCF